MYIFDTEADGLLDEVTKIHCYVTKQHKKDNWIVCCDVDKLPQEFIDEVNSKYSVEWLDVSYISEVIIKSKAIACHNMFGYDLEMLYKLGHIESYDFEKVNGKSVGMYDTLSMSRCLSPDRQLPFGCSPKMYNTVTGKYDNVGPHGLAAWGYRVANKKPQVDDWRNQPLEVYVNRCIEDVVINELTLDALVEESNNTAVGGSWKTALRINNKSDYLMNKQEREGILIDQEAAWNLLHRVDSMMADIEEEVEPQLPEREIPKSKRPNFPANPFNDNDISIHGWNWLKRLGYELNEEYFNQVKLPANPWKKNGDLSSHGLKFCEKMGWDGTEDELSNKIRELRKYQGSLQPLESEELLEQAFSDLENKKMPKMTEPMKLSNQDDLKKYLVIDGGWEPTIWRTKDITRDLKKVAVSEADQIEKAKKYIEDVKASPYLRFIEEEMGIKFSTCRSEVHLLRDVMKKGRFLVSSPKLKDDRGELCPNLEKIEAAMAKQVVKWLSLRNRRGVLKAFDEKKTTGWLNNPRLQEDGRIGQGFSGVTNTNRYKHVRLVNLPKAAPDVLLGYEIRSLLVAPKGKTILGYDGSNLEQFVAASYAYKYDGGEYARQLDGDPHMVNSIAYSKATGREVSRGEGKGVTYSVLYGAQKAKVAKVLGVSQEVAQKVINAFWDTNYGLKELKERLEKYWESNNKKYIMGIDGRKIYTRSKHSLVNALFQSCGSLIMFLSGCYMYDMLKEEGLIDLGVQRLAFIHDEYQYEVPKSIIISKRFSTKEEAKEFVDPEGKLWSNVREFEGSYYRLYCRVGELGNESLKKAGEYFNMALPFSAAYDIGNNFAETH